MVGSEARNFIMGVVSSLVATIVWEMIPQSQTYKLAQLEGNPLAFVEHYHFGLGSLILAPHFKTAKPYLIGLGIGLIASEATQPNPFAVGKPTFGASTALASGMTTVLSLSYVVAKK